MNLPRPRRHRKIARGTDNLQTSAETSVTRLKSRTLSCTSDSRFTARCRSPPRYAPGYFEEVQHQSQRTTRWVARTLTFEVASKSEAQVLYPNRRCQYPSYLRRNRYTASYGGTAIEV
jgi:hypothetical protein